ncbi:MAG: ATPase domain-containing protein [Methanomassiliicoccales archaeon]
MRIEFLRDQHVSDLLSWGSLENAIIGQSNIVQQMQSLQKERKLCATGIECLDRILGGGVPVGHVVLVIGASGTGKTTLSLEFLIRGAIASEKGIFVSTVSPVEKILSSIDRFDFFDRKMLEDGRLNILHIDAFESSIGDALILDSLEKGMRLADLIGDKIRKINASRLVIDSFSSFSGQSNGVPIGPKVLSRLSSILFEAKCTAMVTADELKGSELAVADGVILMGDFERRGDLLRTMQVIKMRGVDHSRSRYVIDLTSCGVLATPLLRGGSR